MERPPRAHVVCERVVGREILGVGEGALCLSVSGVRALSVKQSPALVLLPCHSHLRASVGSRLAPRRAGK